MNVMLRRLFAVFAVVLVVGGALRPGAAEATAQEPAAAPAGPVRGLAFSPDGRLLAVAAGNQNAPGTLTVWDTQTRRTRLVHREAVGVAAVEFLPDGRALAIGLIGPGAKIVDASSGQTLGTLEGHTGGVWSIAVSRDGRLLATGSDDRTIRLWMLGDGAEVTSARTLEGHGATVWSVALSPDARTLVSCGGEDATTRVWDVETGEVKHALKPTQFLVRHVTFSPDGEFFASCQWDGIIRIRESATATLRARLGGTECAVFSPDGRTLAACSRQPEVRLYDVNLAAPDAELRKRIADLIARWDDDDYAVREAASRDVVAVGLPAEPQLRAAMESESAEVRIRARRAHQKVWAPEPRTVLKGHAGEVAVVRFSPDGRLLASGDRSGQVKLWDTATWKEAKSADRGNWN